MKATFLLGLAGSSLSLCIAAYWNWKALQTYSWLPAPARLVQATVEESPATEGTSYLPVARYEYRVGDRVYQGSRIYLVDVGSPSSRRHESALEQIAALSKSERGFVVRYDPSHPERAVVFPGLSLGGLLALVLGCTMTGIFAASYGSATSRSAAQPHGFHEYTHVSVSTSSPFFRNARMSTALVRSMGLTSRNVRQLPASGL